GTQDLIAYWNDRYFEGVTPPIVLPSAAAVVAYLNVEPGAIGYLAIADVDTSCRVLLVIEGSGDTRWRCGPGGHRPQDPARVLRAVGDLRRVCAHCRRRHSPCRFRQGSGWRRE